MIRTVGVLCVSAVVLNQAQVPQTRPVRDPDRPVVVFVIDLADNDLQLVPPDQGVRFDIDGTGTPRQIGWTKAGADDAFLFLDTNNNGRVDSGRELIGDGWRRPDGQRVYSVDDALMVIQGLLDPLPLGEVAPENVKYVYVDPDDDVFDKVRLWCDTNHNGESEAVELRTLKELDVFRIATGFRIRRTEQAGSVVHFEGHVFLKPPASDKSEPGKPRPESRYPRRMAAVEFGRK
jgi:hypothetical protein